MAFHPLEKLSRLYDGYMMEHRVGQHSLLLIQQEGKLFLIRNLCPHKNFPLHTGTLKGNTIRCAYHGMSFDLASRKCHQHPSSRSLCLQAIPLAWHGMDVGVDTQSLIKTAEGPGAGQTLLWD